MGSPRHSPRLGYLLAISFILSISPQCVNSFNGVFNVRTMYVRKSHHGHRHGRTLSGASPIEIPVVGGNSTLPLYVMEIAVGTPPQKHKVLLDTGSAPIWLNCKGCQNCRTENKELGVSIPPYDPALSTTSNMSDFSRDHCRAEVDGKCKFAAGYGADGRGIEGYTLEDNFVIGNQLMGAAITAKLRFGCVTKHIYSASSDGTEFFNWGVDGIVGFGNYGGSLIKQLSRSGVAVPKIAHCLNNINGGGVFAVGHLLEPKVVMVDRFDDDYDMPLLGLDFGGEKIAMNGASSLAVFDCGADVLFVPEPTFNDLNAKFQEFLAQKNAIVKKPVGGGSCFKLQGMDLSHDVVDKEFPFLSLHFAQSQVFKVSPHNYIRREIGAGEGFWCLHVAKVSGKTGGMDVFYVGSSFMSEKLMVYDNANNKMGFVDHDCSAPIQLEGGNGKPVSVGP